MPEPRLCRTSASVRFMRGFTADSCKPASARRMGTPDFSSVCSWRLNSILSTDRIFGSRKRCRSKPDWDGAAAGRLAAEGWIVSGVTPRDSSMSATTAEVAPSSVPLTAPSELRPV